MELCVLRLVSVCDCVCVSVDSMYSLFLASIICYVFFVVVFFLIRFLYHFFIFFFSSRRRHTRCLSDWSSDVCSSDLCALTVRVCPAQHQPYICREQHADQNHDHHQQPDHAQAGLVVLHGCLEACLFVEDRKSTRLNSSHLGISYAVFCLKKKKN